MGFNIDNDKKCFLSSKSIDIISILEWLLKDHVTLKTGVMILNIQLCKKNIFKYIQKIEISYFKL